MLPPFIIEQIRKREEEERPLIQPALELPLPHPEERARDAEDDADRGVVIIDLVG